MKIVEKMILQDVIRRPLIDTSNYFSAFKLSAVPERACLQLINVIRDFYISFRAVPKK